MACQSNVPLRDHFAALAMQAMVGGYGIEYAIDANAPDNEVLLSRVDAASLGRNREAICREAYAIADVMMAERQQGGQQERQPEPGSNEGDKAC